MHDTVSDTNFKVDLRIINDKIIQRYNTENDIAVAEVAEEDSGDAKFVSDRYKISIENKVIIDRYLLDGVKIISVDALQISGLQVFFLNTSLKEPGLYVSTELCDYSITKSLSNFARYVDLAIQLLCFRDACVSNSNLYDNHSSQKQDEKRSGKRSADSMQYDELTTMQEWIRGTWNPPRSNKTPPPEAPKNLWKS
jgi:hypothetical protein